MKKKAIACIILALTFVFSSISGFASEAMADSVSLTDEQRNAISMLNYITVLTQDINSSKNSRLYMEKAYSRLINNTYPNAVDSLTLNQLTGLLDIMENYRMIAVKRDRLQFIYEQNQAKAIRAAVPNPLSLLNVVQSGNKAKIALAIAYMAVDSITSYTAYTESTDLQYIQDGWALDDEEATVLHNSRKNTFSYMIKMVRDYNLPGDLTLTENAVDEFVKWKNNSNTVGRIHFLESNKQTYQNYGGYWLLLAESYYNNSEYKKCLESIDAYEAISTRIFRRDYELARVLPLAVDAADRLYSNAVYEQKAERYVQLILDNSDHDDWALRYFAAQTYVDLYGKTKKPEHLGAAYTIVLDNVNYLVSEQRSLNATYLSPVEEVQTPKDATKDEKRQIKNYNKMLKEARKTELPPVYEPLQLNCELLFAIANKLSLSTADKNRIDGILHPNGEALFLSAALDSAYWMNGADYSPTLDMFDYAGTAVKIPCYMLTADSSIKVTVQGDGSTGKEVYTDWKLISVSREKNKGLEGFSAIFESESAKKHEWKPGETLTIIVTPKEGSSAKEISVKYKTISAKNAWYDYFKVWEGQNNEWYDYLKVWKDKVKFERVG